MKSMRHLSLLPVGGRPGRRQRPADLLERRWSGFVQTTVDNGPGEVDASRTTFAGAPPPDCTSLAPVDDLLSMTEGNYTVRPGANGRQR
jgi:hypothetical protein